MKMTSMLMVVGFLVVIRLMVESVLFARRREKRKKHYRENVLTSGLWKRKRWLVLRRDSGRCVYCGRRATQVHHKKYAKVNIGREPIEWLVSICPRCHEQRHGR